MLLDIKGYIKVIENMKNCLMEDGLKLALVGVMEVALEEYECGGLSALDINIINRMINESKDNKKEPFIDGSIPIKQDKQIN